MEELPLYANFIAAIICGSLMVWIGRGLSRTNRHFLERVTGGDTILANSGARLGALSFYFVSIGTILLMTEFNYYALNMERFLQLIVAKIGGYLLVVGGMQLLTLNVLSRLNRSLGREST